MVWENKFLKVYNFKCLKKGGKCYKWILKSEIIFARKGDILSKSCRCNIPSKYRRAFNCFAFISVMDEGKYIKVLEIKYMVGWYIMKD